MSRFLAWILLLSMVTGLGLYGWMIYKAWNEPKQQLDEVVAVSQLKEWGEKKLEWCKRTCPNRTDAGFDSDGHCICLGWPMPCPVGGSTMDGLEIEEFEWQPSPP